MTNFNRKPPRFIPQQDTEVNWDTFSGGWNNLFKPTELQSNELAQADNLMLVGKGTPTGRWGSTKYFLAGSGSVRGLGAFYNSSASQNYLLSVTDLGLLTKKNGASYTAITGASFASGQPVQMTQISNTMFLVSPNTPLVKFDGTNLVPYTSLNPPGSVLASMLSFASGFTTYSWIVSTIGAAGETIGSTAKTLASLPLDLTKTSIFVSWAPASSAPSTVRSFSIFRGFPGEETLLAGVGPTQTTYIDTGEPTSDTVYPSLTNRTAGPIAKYILRFNDRIVLSGISGDPTLVLISAKYPDVDRFDAIDGGGRCYVSPNDGDDVTGLGMSNIQTTSPLIVVYKKNSTHVISLDTVQLGSFVILDPHVYLQSSSVGASSGDTVVAVENDTYAFGNKGLYSTGQMAQYLNQVRSNEISARVRTYIQGLTAADINAASAAYIDYKYVISFPFIKETLVFDVQRGAFMGPWKTPFGITKWLRYFDETGAEKYLAGRDDAYVTEFSSAYISDDGTAIAKLGRTKKEDLGSWNMMKILKYFYFLLRNVRGSVTVNLRIEERSGNTVTTKTATIASDLGNGGWGSDQWGSQQFGQTSATIVVSGDELARFAQIYKQMRVVQVEFSASGANSQFEFLGIRMTASSLGPSSLPSSLKV